MYHRGAIIVQTDGWDGSLGEVRYREHRMVLITIETGQRKGQGRAGKPK